MTIHYHGTPINPLKELRKMVGSHFCVSHATYMAGGTEMLPILLEIAQSILYDNGAFSHFSSYGTTWLQIPRNDLYAWLRRYLAPPHWAIIPDVIAGSVDDERFLQREWPFPRELSAPVFHLDKPLDYILELTDKWPRVCLGSAGPYWKVGGPLWQARMDELFNYLMRHRQFTPYLHGLRMLAQIGKRWPLASADSTNVAKNFKRNGENTCCMGNRIEAVNGPYFWVPPLWDEALAMPAAAVD